MRSPPSWLPAPVSISVAAHVAALALAPLPRSHAQAPTGAARAAPDSTVEVVAGPQYAAGWLTRLLFGTDYRAAWTAPIRVPVLDLRRAGGGLTPTSVGGGMQTKSMWFRGGDGYEYGFRSVDKDASNLPPGLQGTLLERLALDQNSAQHPAAPIVAARLTEAAGLLHTDPILVVLPDDPALGEHRERFKHTLGTFERRATLAPPDAPFAGAREIISSTALLARLSAGLDDRVDVHAFLKARLFDLWLGDRDRHRGQWTWARLDDAHPRVWVPIPEDRDQAFVRFDGLILSLVRGMTGQLVAFEAGELLAFGPDYASVVGATWGGRELDRLLLPGLEPAVWDSIIQDLRARLSDAVIDDALRRLPPAYYELHGSRLASALRARREQLAEFAARFRRLLATEADLHATNAADLITAEWNAAGDLSLAMASRGQADAPYRRRVFAAGETKEIRLFLEGGADSVTIRGPGGPARLRIVGGGGAVVIDSSGAGRVHLYSPTGTDRWAGVRRLPVDRRPYRPRFTVRERALPPRDWGHQWDPTLLAAAGPDIGVLVGGGPIYTRYGFWQYPYAYRIQARLAVATGPLVPVGDLRLTGYRRNSGVHTDLYLRGSGIDVLRYHGLGNDVVLTQENEYYLVDQRQFEITPTVTFPFLRHSRFRIGPTAQYNRTKDQPGRIIDDVSPYGSENFGQLGVVAELELDLRPRGSASVRGTRLALGARVFPRMWDVESAFTDLHAEALAYLGSETAPLRPVLALRAGGKAVLGGYPFHEAAYIGDRRTVRLGRQNRYGGDASLYGNAELRFRLARLMLVVPSELGLLGLADVGRVFLSGEASDTWHTAFGGGAWLAPLDPRNAISLAVARGSERTAVYFGVGFAF